MVETSLEKIFLHQKAASLRLRKQDISVRLEFLSHLEKAIQNNLEDISAALVSDFSKPKAETLLTEIFPVMHEIRLAKRNLKSWTKPKKVKAPITMLGTQNFVISEPRGVCLIVGPWNYPFQLCISPLICAVAAGNTAFIKPSEFTPATNKILIKIIKEAFPEEIVAIVEGGPETTQELLELPFDHIFFTGSTRVGKIIMEAASKHLSSITLELGGKSPTIIDSSANLKIACEKLVWSKFINAGQTCVAPDYILVQKNIINDFKSIFIATLNQFYGSSDLEKKNSPDFARIITQKHTERLQELIQNALSLNAEIITGGEVDLQNRYVAPTVLHKVDPHATVMQDEIFGPILPLIEFKDIHEAIHFVNERPKPLALYIYSQSESNISAILKETSSGGVCVNDSIIHLANPHLPFGGVGPSGIGSYHGVHGFRAFSHEKAVLRQSWLGILLRVTYPPYTGLKMKILNKLIQWKL
ncbi:aldehyde dehydrogenase family protein [Bdellovibrio reynosensis]|uniref:Aldehyde dehydrogenase n=1 Tax=Bdellovibrio reynosensis TaxID=2835041 RepID=A0ABY4CDI4_9BACT|nr:aldehyde dehydrogenase family protein [Bdellovibrio reynosensis]UOF01781.1 aldehyde dehydrogenase family protein [Bdellovibrio reynosensis]